MKLTLYSFASMKILFGWPLLHTKHLMSICSLHALYTKVQSISIEKELSIHVYIELKIFETRLEFGNFLLQCTISLQSVASREKIPQANLADSSSRRYFRNFLVYLVCFFCISFIFFTKFEFGSIFQLQIFDIQQDFRNIY